jgi:hypothetical protein
VSNAVLKSYCDRKKIDFLSAGEYQDHLFQYQHDQRAIELVPKILAKVAEYQYIPDYISDKKKEEMRKANEALQYDIAKICEDGGIYYREVDVLTKNLAGEIGAVIETAGTRINNMCSLVISTVAQEKFGDGLKVADLAHFHRVKAGLEPEKEVE